MAEEVEFKDPEEITDDDKLWALLSYIIPIVALLALLMEDKKDRPFVKYHAIHSLLLVIVMIIFSVVPPFCFGLVPWLYGLFLGFKAYQGEKTEIPALTNFAKGQGWV